MQGWVRRRSTPATHEHTARACLCWLGTHQARDDARRLEPSENRVRELQRPVALALGVRVRRATVDVALVHALADVLRCLRKVQGVWLRRPALGPRREDEVDLAVRGAGCGVGGGGQGREIIMLDERGERLGLGRVGHRRQARVCRWTLGLLTLMPQIGSARRPTSTLNPVVVGSSGVVPAHPVYGG